MEPEPAQAAGGQDEVEAMVSLGLMGPQPLPCREPRRKGRPVPLRWAALHVHIATEKVLSAQ
jgi:hypothetical protein